MQTDTVRFHLHLDERAFRAARYALAAWSETFVSQVNRGEDGDADAIYLDRAEIAHRAYMLLSRSMPIDTTQLASLTNALRAQKEEIESLLAKLPVL